MSLEIAGNIIPAIATTNAMIAGLSIMQAFKVMREDISRAKMVHLQSIILKLCLYTGRFS